jgi:TonB family protein
MVRRCSVPLIVALLVVVSLLPLQGQTQTPEVQNLARKAAEKIKDTGAQHILIAAASTCMLKPDLCDAADSTLRMDLSTNIEGVQFLGKDDAVPFLTRHGLLPIDAYNNGALERVAPDVGAQLVVSEGLNWESDGYEASIRVWDSGKQRAIETLRAKIAGVKHEFEVPMVFKDPTSGVGLIIGNDPQHKPRIFRFPMCVRCPEPRYPQELSPKRVEGIVVLLATITEQGTAQNISVLQSPNDLFTTASVEAVRGWQFKPAIGNDELPFAARVPIEVNFRIRAR